MSDPESPNATLSVPLKLDAFILNAAVCDGGELDAKIAPITQPNYTFLRLTNYIIQNDILPPVDLHNTTPPTSNPRLTDLATSQPRTHRQGVYLHWLLPRFYRSGLAATSSGTDAREEQGLPPPTDAGNTDPTTPQYRAVPTRWLVVRRLHTGAVPDVLREWTAWVVESDRRRDVNDIPADVDLQVDVSPMVSATKEVREVKIDVQAEVFIGQKFAAKEWEEVEEQVDRVRLSALDGGNVLFADFQQHNGNVFSVLDNFEYIDGDGEKKYLERATASYYVIGWHAGEDDDPLHIVQPVGEDAGITRASRVEGCQMAFNDATTPDNWLASLDSARTVCHGAMYTVNWDVSSKPANLPADKHAHNLQNNLPLAVGTTPLDALLAYIHAHRDSPTDPATKQVIESIIFIQRYLVTLDDSVDGQAAADDQLLNTNYDAVAGGTRYHLAGASGNKPATRPSDAVAEKLGTLNRETYRLDALRRAAERVQWELFSLWWKWVCDGTNAGSYKIASEGIMTRWNELKRCINESNEIIEPLLDPVLEPDMAVAEPGVLPSWYTQRDPTLLVGGIESGWPADWLDRIRVRLNTHITGWSTRNQLDGGVVDEVGIKNLPDGIQNTAKALLTEFINLDPTLTDKDAPPYSPPEGTFTPLYHDLAQTLDDGDDDTPAPWRDRWENTQPWFPLFLEWEAEYAHVKYSSFSLEDRPSLSSVPSDPTATKLRFGIKDGEILFDDTRPDRTDRRTLSGRVLILPQPTFSLESKIHALFDSVPASQLDDILPESARNQLLENLHRLAFLSAPLAGFHDHLSTAVQGTHIKPVVRHAGERLLPLSAAVAPAAGFEAAQFEVIGTETNLTPYATLVQFYDFPHSAFKPVTHGQFRFTKLNVIDKFGQAIHAIDPRWSADPPEPVYPCVSEFYAPQVVEVDGETLPNTVDKQTDGVNEFVQLGPHINQPTRVNAAFVKRAEDRTSWVPQNEWENPIWGWVVINYANAGIQLFLADGTFYREVRLGGQSGASTSPDAWLPFARPQNPPVHTQLDHLLDRLTDDKTYLHAFVAMINGSLQASPPAPNTYAQFLNSVVGKPLALVNMGWSLEMAVGEYTNQSTLNATLPDKYLLPDPNGATRDLYEFPFQLGDKQRSFDGLVGYFRTLPTQTLDGNDLALDTCYTFFGLPSSSSSASSTPLVEIAPSNFPILKPFHANPTQSASSIETARNAALSANTFGALIDPFTPIHAYSGILPTHTLPLPSWTWQEAMARMTAFFHIGPLVLTKDVPAFDEQYRLRAEYDLKNNETVPGSAVGVPAMAAAGDWDWLQAYSLPKEGEEESAFMPLGLAGTDTRPRFEQAPYTAVEGYLQLKRAIVRAE